MCGCGNSRFMDRNQETTAHKRSRDESSDVRSEGIYHGQEKLSCSDQNRQHNGNSLCKQDGENEISGSDSDDEGPVELLHVQRDHDYCRTPAWLAETDSRLSVQGIQEFQQLETAEISFPSTGKTTRSVASGPVCG